MIRVVLADDHALMREGLKYILRKAEDVEVIAEATDGFEVLALVRKGGFDVLLMDLSMPGRSGMDLIKQIKEEAPSMPHVPFDWVRMATSPKRVQGQIFWWQFEKFIQVGPISVWK
jgi:DNA-binding NarL/FixJ family response regulator